MEKSMIIIGGGIAGLSTGCYGQMNGYKTHIFEMHNLPGGLCTSWKRKGYTIDGCIQWLVGSGPGNDMYRIWQELGALQGRKIIDHDEFLRVEHEEKTLIVYTDADRLRTHMLELSPKDKKPINEFCKAIKSCSRYAMPMDKAPELYSIIDSVKLVFGNSCFLKLYNKYKRITVLDYAKRFSDPFLRRAFYQIFDMPDCSVALLIITLGWMMGKTAGYPIGGSLEFARSIEKRYLDLGGEIHYESKVKKILVERDRAVGVKLQDGTEHRSDIIISAADGFTTIFSMLGGQYIDDKIRRYYETMPIFPPLIYVSLGVNRSFEGMPYSVSYILDEPKTIADVQQNTIYVRFHSFDPTLAPPGKTTISVMLEADHHYWKKLAQNTDKYQSKKQEIANYIISFLDNRFPGLAAQVEMQDVATPITWERFTGNWKGSFEGWLPTTKSMNVRMSKRLPGLDGFYMVGQWVEPGGGLPTAAYSGRNVIQIMCKADKKAFATSVPQETNV